MKEQYIKQVEKELCLMVCLLIYTTMMQTVLNSADVVGSMWSYIAYSGVVLFAIGKIDRISKSIFGAH